MVRLKLEIFPPLAWKLVPGHHGVLTALEEVHEGATLRELLLQLAHGKYERLVGMTYDFEADALTHDVLVIVNNEAIGAKPFADIVLRNGDCVGFLPIFVGG